MLKKYKYFIPLLLLVIGPLLLLGKQQPKLTLGHPEVHEESQMALHVEGAFPEWLEGVFVRNSAIPVFKAGQQLTHEFDGIAMLHGFTFKKGTVSYTSRFLQSEDYNTVKTKDSADFAGFATGSLEKPLVAPDPNPAFVANASVNVFKYPDSFVALTETPLPARFDLKTLETLGSFIFNDSLPVRCWESAHPHFDAATGEIINYLIEFGPESYYVLYRIKENSSTREVLAKVPVEMPSYMHSFAMTKRYIIFTEFPFRVVPRELLTSGKPFIHNFKWQPEAGTRFTVVERSSGKVVFQKTTEPILSFHHANAYEEDDTIIIDLVAYRDISLLPTIFPQAATAVKSDADWRQRFIRYELSVTKNEITPSVLLEASLEFPRFDDRLDGKPYRYVYMTIQQDAEQDAKLDAKTEGLCKLDLKTKELKVWQQPNFVAMEPIFVPSPTAKSEDDGVLLTVIGDASQNLAFVVAIDAKTLTEIARAKLPFVIPSSFHGQYFSLKQ